ncbi:hypothetical protein, partial [Enterobacter hormaechei]|uniref:hypothetical protein n=1 Tax=Enterobacter hormaechei TaxID=158836 RepID=UPI002B202C10
YDLFVGKTLLHGDVLMWLMKTLLTSRCINQRGAGQEPRIYIETFLDGYAIGFVASYQLISFFGCQSGVSEPALLHAASCWSDIKRKLLAL